MLKPVCVPCQRFYKPHKNGRWFVEGMPADGLTRPRPGGEHPEDWRDYKLWCGDEWMCNGCGNTIIVGTGRQPHRVQHQEDFQAEKKALRADLRVNDC